MEKHLLETKRTAFYYTIGNIENPRDLWIVFHGYGQRADDFIKPFENLDLERNGIVAPEALSKFYKGGNGINPGGSWMTRRFRIAEIRDQVVYLDKIFRLFRSKAERVHILGFSQGVPTAARWLYFSKPRVNSMILWAGWPPEDIPYNVESQYWDSLQNFYVYGKQDKYVTAEKIELFNKRVDLHPLNLELIEFEGTHSLSRRILQELSDRFNT